MSVFKLGSMTKEELESGFSRAIHLEGQEDMDVVNALAERLDKLREGLRANARTRRRPWNTWLGLARTREEKNIDAAWAKASVMLNRHRENLAYQDATGSGILSEPQPIRDLK